jgi:osmoprotectant transport system permease protein
VRWLLPLLLLFAVPATAATAAVTVASKKFTEGVILGEIAVQRLRAAGIKATHRDQLGGTRVLWDALRAGSIDVYAEYTGTIRFEMLSAEALASDADLPAALARHGLALSQPLGFSNSYALAMRADRARALGITRMSQLSGRALRYGISNEFVDRADGWRALAGVYGLPADVRGIDHDLAYRALAAGQVDVVDAYTTDAEIARDGLVVLADDRGFFPAYDAVFVYRADFAAPARAAIDALGGRIALADMRAMNAAVLIDGDSERAVAARFVERTFGGAAAVGSGPGLWQRLVARTLEHLALVAAALAGAVVVAVPLGIAAARRPRLGQAVLGAVGVLQTVPSLALLVVLIPLMGIGAAPTIAALFLYSLLPIVRNTHAGLTGIAPSLIDSAEALGLSPAARLRRIELPLAAPTVMAGVKTAAVIAVGLATLGAIVGAGGYGQPILTGIRLNSTPLILEGAVPAALLALAVQALLGFAERRLTPRGLRPRAGEG